MRGVDIALLVDAEVVVAGVVGFIQLSSIHFMGWLFIFLHSYAMQSSSDSVT